MPAHRERELACARGSAGRPGSADNSTACSAPRAAQGTFSTSNRQPPPAAYAAEQPAPTELAQLQARDDTGALRDAVGRRPVSRQARDSLGRAERGGSYAEDLVLSRGEKIDTLDLTKLGGA